MIESEYLQDEDDDDHSKKRYVNERRKLRYESLREESRTFKKHPTK